MFFVEVFINFVQAANALDVQKILTPKNEVAALSCKNGKANLAKDTEVFSTINWSQPLRYFCVSYPGDHRNSKLPWELSGQGEVQLEDQAIIENLLKAQ